MTLIAPTKDSAIQAELFAVGLSESAPDALNALPEGALRAAAARAIAKESFTGAIGSKIVLPTIGQHSSDWLVLVGTGDASPGALRVAAGVASNAARDKGATSMALHIAADGDSAFEAIAEGVVAGNYRFDRNLPEKRRTAALTQAWLLNAGSDAAAALARGEAISTARNLARDLVNGPPADLNPATLTDSALALASDQMSVKVLELEGLQQAGMVGIIAVGQGSTIGPRFVHMVYEPEGEVVAEVALVGKGVTFDAGGLSIKSSEGMSTMRCDMGGAAAVIGAMSALSALNLPVRVHGIFGAVENMLAGNSYKLGDVLHYSNGVTVEVMNTDAEGRLVLADCLIAASKLPVSHIVDLATLTGAAVVALGEGYTALYSDSDGFADELRSAATASGEGFWHMPLEASYKELLKSDWAQVKNVGGRMGGSITAALFLSEFVDGPTWAHLDIAGPAFLSQPRQFLGKGGTGAGTPALLYWLRSLAS